ncbi:hypothetical protein HOY82DRAFT_635470 [Tuber indicum]|nr:hypothetical protein HOY82DRAFT_635470 [Tuber indicum]
MKLLFILSSFFFLSFFLLVSFLLVFGQPVFHLTVFLAFREVSAHGYPLFRLTTQNMENSPLDLRESIEDSIECSLTNSAAERAIHLNTSHYYSSTSLAEALPAVPSGLVKTRRWLATTSAFYVVECVIANSRCQYRYLHVKWGTLEDSDLIGEKEKSTSPESHVFPDTSTCKSHGTNRQKEKETPFAGPNGA